jgi:hypothetical protein
MMDEKVQTFLSNELDRVDKWLSFGEAKNAALVAFNIAVLSVNFDSSCSFLFSAIRICVTLSMIISLVSFWPNMAGKAIKIKIKNERNKPGSNVQESNNYLYFMDIAKLNNGSDYLKILKTEYCIAEFDTTQRLYLDLAEEIVTNSRITVGKYTLFRIALVCDCLAMFIMALFFVCA